MVSKKLYVVELSADERKRLEELIRKGKSPAKKQLKARILLRADESPLGPKWNDPQISEALGTYPMMCARGADPLDAKKADQEAAAARKTFGQCADELIKSKRREWRSEVHAAHWRTTIDDYCGPILDMPVDAIDTQAVLGVLQPVWGRIPETASRLRGRIEAVLDYAKANGLRSGENPAAWRGHLALILPKRQKLSRGHHRAMPYPDIPEFLGKLRESGSIQALALEFTILTAARCGEALGATWEEIDFATKIWVIPASRMKAGREHRVPLSARAMAILDRMNCRGTLWLWSGRLMTRSICLMTR